MTVSPLIDVVEGVPLSGHTLVILFEDDTLKRFDVAPYLKDGTVFEALRDPDHFAAAYVALGTVCWPGNIDLDPELLYERGSAIESLEGTLLTEAEGERLLRMLLRSPSRKGLPALILYYESRQLPNAPPDNQDRQTLEEMQQVAKEHQAQTATVAAAWTKFEKLHDSLVENQELNALPGARAGQTVIKANPDEL